MGYRPARNFGGGGAWSIVILQRDLEIGIPLLTGSVNETPYRKRRETKHQPGRASCSQQQGCRSISLHFLLGVYLTDPVDAFFLLSKTTSTLYRLTHIEEFALESWLPKKGICISVIVEKCSVKWNVWPLNFLPTYEAPSRNTIFFVRRHVTLHTTSR